MVTRISRDMISPSVGGLEVGDYCWSARATKAKWLKCQAQAVSRTTYAALFAEIGVTYGAGDGSTTFNLPDGQGRVLIGSGAGVMLEQFAPAAVNAGTDVITVVSNADKLLTGMKVQISTTGTLPGGLSAGVDYYINRLSATTIRLSTSVANAIAGNIIDITSQGTGTHTLTHVLTSRALGENGGEEAHAMTVAESAPHTHPLKYSNATYTSGAGTQVGTVGSGGLTATTDSTGSGAPHNNMQPYLASNLFIYAGV